MNVFWYQLTHVDLDKEQLNGMVLYWFMVKFFLLQQLYSPIWLPMNLWPSSRKQLRLQHHENDDK